MREIFSTANMPPAAAFKRWREAVVEQFTPIDLRAVEQGPFTGSIEAATVGGVDVSRMVFDAMRSDGRCVPKGRFNRDMLVVNVVVEGSFTMEMDGRETVVRRGGFVVNDGTPWGFVSRERNETLSIEVPRRRFEDVVGPARLYAGLGVDGSLGGASLATGFLSNLLRVEHKLDETARIRMASIALDLFAAATAERLAREPSANVRDSVVVLRAKAYIDAHLDDPRLDPTIVAGASRVSLRRLQELFRRDGHGVAEWIWERRLTIAAAMLGDPAFVGRAIGSVAFSCGFASQAHFSTRFRTRFGLTPRDFRARSGMA